MGNVVYDRSMDVFMGKITLVYQREERFQLIEIVCHHIVDLM